MNMTTTALWLLAASVNEKVFPSTAVSVNSGAGAPTCGPAASTACARRRDAAVTRNSLEERMCYLLQPREKPRPLRIFPEGSDPAQACSDESRSFASLRMTGARVISTHPQRQSWRSERKRRFEAASGRVARRCAARRRSRASGSDGLDQERRTIDDLIEFPDVLLPSVEELDGDLVMRFDPDRLLGSLDRQIVLGDGQIELLRLRQDLPLELFDVPDGGERGLLLHEIVEGRGRDLDRNDLVEAVADEAENGKPDNAPEPASAWRSLACFHSFVSDLC